MHGFQVGGSSDHMGKPHKTTHIASEPSEPFMNSVPAVSEVEPACVPHAQFLRCKSSQ